MAFLAIGLGVREAHSAKKKKKLRLILGKSKIKDRERALLSFLMAQVSVSAPSLRPSTLENHEALQYASIEFSLRLKVA